MKKSSWAMALFVGAVLWGAFIISGINCVQPGAVEAPVIPADAVHVEVKPGAVDADADVDVELQAGLSWEDNMRNLLREFRITTSEDTTLGEGAEQTKFEPTIIVESHPKVSLLEVEGMTVVAGMAVLGVVAIGGLYVYAKVWQHRAKANEEMLVASYDAVEFGKDTDGIKKLNASLLAHRKGGKLKTQSDAILQSKGFLSKSKN